MEEMQIDTISETPENTSDMIIEEERRSVASITINTEEKTGICYW